MSEKNKKLFLSEDWWAVIIAFVLILLSAIGVLGKSGLLIKF
jgi:hypothetical protein